MSLGEAKHYAVVNIHSVSSFSYTQGWQSGSKLTQSTQSLDDEVRSNLRPITGPRRSLKTPDPCPRRLCDYHLGDGKRDHKTV